MDDEGSPPLLHGDLKIHVIDAKTLTEIQQRVDLTDLYLEVGPILLNSLITLGLVFHQPILPYNQSD